MKQELSTVKPEFTRPMLRVVGVEREYGAKDSVRKIYVNLFRFLEGTNTPVPRSWSESVGLTIW